MDERETPEEIWGNDGMGDVVVFDNVADAADDEVDCLVSSLAPATVLGLEPAVMREVGVR